MGKKLTASQQDGVQYRRAKPWRVALSQFSCAAGMCFYMLMTYATYIGNANYGILVAIMTVLLYCGFPILGWICTVLAMRKSELTKEKMIEVQKVNAQRRQASEAD